ncbi:MAG: hypothetical protein ABEK10_02480 [Candidatus Nanosalina sp.]
MRPEEKEEFDPDKLISRTIRFLEEKKKEYVEQVLEETSEAPHTNPNYAEIDVYIGSNDYYRKVQSTVKDMGLEVESYSDLTYSNFLNVLIRHYLQQRLGDTEMKLWSDSNDSYYPLPYLISELEDSGVEWMESNDENVRGRGGKEGIWMYFFPEEEVESLVRQIRLNMAERRKCPQEFREALSEFPKVMNQHADVSNTDWNQFHATFNHELTHNYLHRNSTIKKLNMEFVDSIDEATCQFVGKYVYRKRRTNRKSALDFHSNPGSYSFYANPEEIHYFVEILREHTRYARNNETRLNAIDHVRKQALRFMQDGGKKEDFLKQLTPEEFRIPVQRLERADQGISSKLKKMKEDLYYIERNLRGESEEVQREFEKVKKDFKEIKTPRQIKKEVIEQAYQEMIDERKSYDFIGEFIEKELRREIEEFLDSHRHIEKMGEILQDKRKIEDEVERLEKLNEEIEATEEEFKSILGDLERRTT